VIIAGSGEIQRDDGNNAVTVGDVFVLPEGVRHDLVNNGTETLRAVAFFSNGVVTQNFDNVMLPPDGHILGSPNSQQ
jgi:quercetin dioxygenase-like cupin family protein